MRATKLIEELQSLVDLYGDKEVEVNGAYANDYPLNSTSRLDIASVDIYVDSDNIQIVIDNR